MHKHPHQYLLCHYIIVALFFTQTKFVNAQDYSAPQSAAEEETNYTIENSLTLRDPFKKYKPKSLEKQKEIEIPELERFEVEQFKLVGAITGTKKNKALLTLPNGKLHIVSEFAKVGTRKGKVSKIEKTHIVIEERVVNLLGQEEVLETKISLNKKEDRQ